MKRIILIMLLLAACAPIPPPVPAAPNITATSILDEFAKIDSELNTSWRNEQIPGNMIRPDAVEPWTAHLVFLKDRITAQNNSLLNNLVEARIAMLKSQVAFYLTAEIGEKGIINLTLVNITKAGKTFAAAEKIDCGRVPVVAKSIGLYSSAFTAWKNFNLNMDTALQDIELRQRIGVNENRSAFYKSHFGDAEALIDATKIAVAEQCGVEIVIQ